LNDTLSIISFLEISEMDWSSITFFFNINNGSKLLLLSKSISLELSCSNLISDWNLLPILLLWISRFLLLFLLFGYSYVSNSFLMNDAIGSELCSFLFISLVF